jgi:hypothetical protein
MVRTTPALTAAEAERLIRQFESQGDHRTGSPGDDACTRWLIDELTSHGIDAEAQPYAFPRLAIERAEITISGRTVPGVPLYDGGFTPPDGVDAKLIEADSAPGAIALWYREADPNFFGPAIYESLLAAHQAGTLGVVIVAGDDQGAPVVRNAERIDDPLPIPVLQVAPADWPDTASLRDAVDVTLTIDATRAPGPATNVVATIPGSDPDATPVVLMTPKSGWFRCAAERGGGHAVWLTAAAAIARDAASNGNKRPLWLVCSGGHELHHYGLDAYLDALPFSVSDVHCWIHLGASIGAREPRPALAASDPGLQQLMVDALSQAGAIERTLMPLGAPGGGEARNVAERGGRFVSILGGHRYFHSPNDTVDLAVDSDSVARHAEAVTGVLRTLLNRSELSTSDLTTNGELSTSDLTTNGERSTSDQTTNE